MIAVAHSAIALRNPQAQIDGLEPIAPSPDTYVEQRVRLIELLAVRGSILGSVTDHEQAQELAHELVRNATTYPAAFLARAHIRTLFRRFEDALDDLDVAERLAADADTVNREHAAVLQGLGHYAEAFAIREEDARLCPSFESLAALASLCAESGDTERALRIHHESQRLYRGTSPIALAILEFQLGVMWRYQREPDRARDHLIAARGYVAGYAPAQGHLAEVEAELGNAEIAIALLRPLAQSSDDPEYAAQLARILADAGCIEESRRWRQLAAKRYDQLVALYPEAFADHAAEFWLGAGGNPEKALHLAQLNITNCRAPRAHALLARAVGVSPALPRVPGQPSR